MSSPVLTPKREAFCQHYVAHRDATAAYRHAYDVLSTTKDITCHTAGSKVLRDDSVINRIEELQREIAQASIATPGEPLFDAARAMNMFLEIATADPRELIGLRVGACRFCYGEGHRYQWREVEYFEELERAEALQARGKDAPLPDPGGGFGYRMTRDPNPDCPRCEGEGVERIVARDTSKLSPAAARLYGGVKKKKDGYEIIIADQQKALENAARIIGAFKDNIKVDNSITAMLNVVQQSYKTDDPQELSRLYQTMIRGHLNG